jgi:hypothetical protein
MLVISLANSIISVVYYILYAAEPGFKEEYGVSKEEEW